MKYSFRMRSTFIPLLLAIIASMSPVFGQKVIDDIKPTIILISLDGFRYDYLDKHQPPNLVKLAKNGVRAKWMQPSFPTKTNPNHYTVVTGLYPANHGIVDNTIYDYGVVMKMSDRRELEKPRWWGGEPIWVTAEKQGQISANYFWPGSEAPIGGKMSANYRLYNSYLPFSYRVDKLLSYLDLPQKQRPTILTLYYEETDEVGHEFGPDSEELKYAVMDADAIIGRLMDGLARRGIADKVNVIITSDHGMATYDARKVVFLDEAFDQGLAEQVVYSSPLAQIFPKPGKLDVVFEKVKELKNLTCTRKEDLPERFHYKQGKRVAPIFCVADKGWIVSDRKSHESWINNQDGIDRPRGNHGYDNEMQEMQATFIAHGPAFKKGMLAEPFANIEVYNLMCEILGLTPATNDGKLDRVKHLLR